MQESSDSVEGEIYLRLSKIVMDNTGSDGTGCLGIKVRSGTTEFTDMRIVSV